MEKQFDPTKQYRWEKEQAVTITGEQFGAMQAAVSLFLNQPAYIAAMQANQALLQILTKEVAEGNFIEVESKTD